MRKALYLLLLLLVPQLVLAQSATITWTNVHQTIDGFGVADGSPPPGSDVTLTTTQANQLFSTSTGIGLSLLRTAVPDDGSCTTVNATCGNQDLANMNKAVALGAKIWSAPWSPPASMKTNGSIICNTGSGAGSLSGGSYAAYATYLSNYIGSLTGQGISLYALSVQNEPDFCPTTYDGASWSNSNFDTFIKTNLGPTLASNGHSGVRVMMPESSQFSSFSGLANTCMTDSSCYAFVGINAWHDYDASWNPPNTVTNPYSSLGKGYWETETSGGIGFGPSLMGGMWDPSMADGLLWASIIDNRMAVANANAWHYWVAVSADLGGGASDNEGLYNADGVTTSKRMFVMGNYAKFVRPGWVNIDATHVPVSGVTVSAYKDPSGSGNFAIVVTNQNSSGSSVTFNLSRFGTVSTVTPWLTSASANLASQSPVTVTSQSFNVTSAANSVTTFVGTAGGGGGGCGTPLWAGIIDCTRAAPWSRSTVGVPGGIPSASWSQCGATIPAYGTMGTPASPATINNAAQACPNNTYVLLGNGTFWMNSTVLIQRSNVVIRGSGPNSTTIACPTGGSVIIFASECIAIGGNQNSPFANPGTDGTPPGGTHAFSWTAGYAQGATSITIASVGSAGILNGDMIVLDQGNDTTDNGGQIVCDSATTAGGCSQQGGSYSGRGPIAGLNYNQEQIIKVVSGCASSCNGAGPYTLTITPGLYANNWNSTTGIGGFFVNPITNAGFENLMVTDGGDTGCSGCSNIGIANVDKWWIKNVASLHGHRNHLWSSMATHGEVRDSYFYGTQNASIESYGVEMPNSSDNLVENNIFQQVASPFIGAGASSGNVYGYNYSIDMYYNPAFFMQASYSSHDAGNSFNLYEGNQTNGLFCDDVHGTSTLQTDFRNILNGRDYNTFGGLGFQPTAQTYPIDLQAFCRAHNLLGNVLGTVGYHLRYQNNPGTTVVNCDTSLFDMGWGGYPCQNFNPNPGTGILVNNDTVVASSVMRWGNVLTVQPGDVLSVAARFDNTEASPGAIAHVGAQAVPASHALPPSFYYSAKPSFWTTPPWPPAGPDVTGGTGPGGFSYDIPARVCYAALSGPADGSGSPLAFDSGPAAVAGCKYGTSAPAPPIASLSVTAHNFGQQPVSTTSGAFTVTMTNIGTANLVMVSETLATGTNYAISGNTCLTAMLVQNASCTVNLTFHPLASGFGATDTLTFTDNASPSTQTVSLSGNGVLVSPGPPLGLNGIPF